MAKPELGSKRLCGNCGTKFYDLSKDPIVCPKCSTVLTLAPAHRSRAEASRAKAEEEVVTPEVGEAEFVALEEADASGKVKTEEGEDDIEIEDDEDDAAAFLPDEEDENADVADIIGESIENDEET